MTSDTDTPEMRVGDLAARVRQADLEYAEGRPTLTDHDYDALREELRALLDERPDLTPEDNPLDSFWQPEHITNEVRHTRPMLSLQKIRPADRVTGVTEFLARFPGQKVSVMRKIDGVSASVVYENGRLKHVATRGNGTVGENITHILDRSIRGIPKTIPTQTGTCEIRGEMVMKRSTHRAYNENNPDRALANPRNAASGVLGLKDPELAKGRELDFIAFETDEGDADGMTEKLRSLGMTPVDMAIASSAEEVLEVVQRFEDDRLELDYDTDGVVIKLASEAAFRAAGVRSDSARGAVAVKFPAEERETTLEDVRWEVGPGGKVVPRAVLERVFVAGTFITSATLANQSVIRQRGVKIGQRVIVKRAGDVIPFVAGPAPSAVEEGTREVDVPTHCPSCGEPLEVRGNSQELYCTNVSCPAQGLRRLVHWAGRSAADMDAVGPVWIEKLFDDGKLRTVADFYALDAEALQGYHGMGEVSMKRMLDSIERSKRVGLRRALIGLGIRHAREGTAKRLCRAGYERIEDVAAATSEQLQQVEDIGPVVADSIVEFFSREETAELIARLRERGVDLDVHEEDRPVAVAEAAETPLRGKTVVVTGTLVHPDSGEKIPRPDFVRLVEQAGATNASSVSKNTDMLICGDNVGASKTAKAEKLEVAVVPQAEAWAWLRDAGLT